MAQKQNQKDQLLFQAGQFQTQKNFIRESNFYQQYLKLMKTHNIQNLTQITKLLSNVNQQQIHFLNRSLIKNEFNYIKVFQTMNGVIQIYQVQLASFKLQLSVFRTKERNLFLAQNLTQYISNGRFGQVYKLSLNCLQMDIAIKYISKNENNVSLIQVIKQCSFLKLFSAFQAGVPYKKAFGFDIIQTDQNFMISMESGIELNQYIQKYDKSLKQLQTQLYQLQQSLLKVHLFQIVHCDIKPQNIVYSHSLKKLVFIDFGFSQCKINKIGTCLQQQFKGSFFYCSQQMKRVLSIQKDFVDMYYNDVICWLKTKKYIFSQVQTKQNKCFSVQVLMSQGLKYQIFKTPQQKNIQKNLYLQQKINECDFLIVKLIFVISQFNQNYLKEQLKKNKVYKKILQTNFQKIAFIFKQYYPCAESYLIFNYLIQKQLNCVNKNDLSPFLRSIDKYLSSYQISQQIIQNTAFQRVKSLIDRYSNQYLKYQLQFSQLYNFMIQCLSKKKLTLHFKLNLLNLMKKVISFQDIKALTNLNLYKLIEFGMNLVIQNVRSSIRNYKIQEQILKQLKNFKLINYEYIYAYAFNQNYCLVRFLKLVDILTHITHDFVQFFQFQICQEVLFFNQQLLYLKITQCNNINANQTKKNILFYLKHKILSQMRFNLAKQLYQKFILGFNNHKLHLMIDCFKTASLKLKELTYQMNLHYPSYKFYLNGIKTFFMFFIIPFNLSKYLKKQQLVKQFILSVKQNKLVNAAELTDIQNMKINLIPFYFQTQQLNKAIILLEQYQIKNQINSQTLNQLYQIALNFFYDIGNDKMCLKYQNKLSEKAPSSILCFEKIISRKFLGNSTDLKCLQNTEVKQKNISETEIFNQTNFQDKFIFLVNKLTNSIQKGEHIGNILSQFQSSITKNQIYLSNIFAKIKQQINQSCQRILNVTKLQIRCSFINLLLFHSTYVSKQFILKAIKQCEQFKIVHFKNYQQPIPWVQLKFNYFLKFQQKILTQQIHNQFILNFEKWNVNNCQIYLLVLTALFKIGNKQSQKLKRIFSVIVNQQKTHILFKKRIVDSKYIHILIQISISQLNELVFEDHSDFIVDNTFFLFILQNLALFAHLYPCNNYSSYLNQIYSYSKKLFIQYFEQRSYEIFQILLRYFLKMTNIERKQQIIGFFYMILLSINEFNFKQYENVLKKVSLSINLVQFPCKTYILSQFYQILSKINLQKNQTKSLFYIKLQFRQGNKVKNDKLIVHYLWKKGVLVSHYKDYYLMFLKKFRKINELK